MSLRTDPVVTVSVPFQDSPLEPPPAERVRRLRRHLVSSLRDLREARRPDRLIQPATAEPAGFAADVLLGLLPRELGEGGGYAVLRYEAVADVDEEFEGEVEAGPAPSHRQLVAGVEGEGGVAGRTHRPEECPIGRRGARPGRAQKKSGVREDPALRERTV